MGSTFVPPNMFEIAVKNLKEGYNERGYIKTVVRQYKLLIEKYGEKIQDVYDLLEEHYPVSYTHLTLPTKRIV